MPNWKSGMPSKYLQAVDLDRPIIATIDHVGSETLGSGDNAERKLVVRFRESHVKPVVLNITRAQACEDIAGDPDTDRWTGHKVKLVKDSTLFKGKRVPCIGIEAPDDIDVAMATRASGGL
jgi:hypothetical protein